MQATTVVAHERGAGEESGFLLSSVAELCILVASVRVGLWAQRAVKLKAAAQSGLLPGVSIKPELLPHQERAFLRGALCGVGQRSLGVAKLRGLWHGLAELWGGAARPLGCLLSGKSEDLASCLYC